MAYKCSWWEAKPPKGENKDEWERSRATDLIEETARIENRQKSRHEFALWNSTLFYNRVLPGFRWGATAAEEELAPADLRTENLVQSIGESMLSKASSQPLIPSPVSHGTSYTHKQAIDKLQKFIAATWIQTEAENAAVQAFLDAYVAAVGAVQVHYDDDTLSLEPVFFDNIIVDNRECVNRTPPRTVRKRMVLPRVSIEAAYGITLDEYNNKPYVEYREVGSDWAILVEAFRKPDKKGNGGRHTIACCGQILADEEWNEDWFPIVFLHWADVGSGFFGRSGVEQCIPYQVAQNDVNDAIKKTQDICSRPRLLSHANSNIDINQWDNEFGRILGYTGEKPEPFEWPTNLSDLYQERERNRASCFSYFGLSEMSAGADLPSQVRLDSSAGVREFRNMEDSRHLRLWTRFEKFRLEIAHRFIDVLGRKKAGKFKVSYFGGSKASSEYISWEDIKDVKKSQYSWTLEAVPLSMQSPAARRETLQAWQSEGKVKPDDDISMVGNPDLERIDMMENASENNVNRMMGLMEKGEYESPTTYTNLTYGIRAVIANIDTLSCYTEGVHPEAIALHERWLLEAMNIQKTALLAQQPTPPTPGFDPASGLQGSIS